MRKRLAACRVTIPRSDMGTILWQLGQHIHAASGSIRRLLGAKVQGKIEQEMLSNRDQVQPSGLLWLHGSLTRTCRRTSIAIVAICTEVFQSDLVDSLAADHIACGVNWAQRHRRPKSMADRCTEARTPSAVRLSQDASTGRSEGWHQRQCDLLREVVIPLLLFLHLNLNLARLGMTAAALHWRRSGHLDNVG